ncbi:Dynamin-related protein 4C [Camellia lanceoleosa]|uniref:Dynamin-related protein 4C n=1 Tax=Camellia lanceoleosa TaxID=1840588 RepID=A0ACC0IM17_9ERIC|nr:Dynamin-related protein 4C [Camellia lanceoleosa]
MEGCPVTAACLDSLAAIPALLYLNLSRCNLFDDGCEKFSGLRNLKVLNLGFNDISDACLLHMREEWIGRVQSLNCVKSCNSLRNSVTAYWKIVLRRFVDNLALHLLLSINEVVNRNIEVEIVNEVMGSHGGHGIERMLEELPPVAMKRKRLNKSIRLLKESMEVVAQIID